MIKFEVIYEGSKRKISLSDGRVLEMTNGRIIFMPEQDWYSTYSKTGNFKLVAKELEEIEKVIEAEEEKEEEKEDKKSHRRRGRKKS